MDVKSPDPALFDPGPIDEKDEARTVEALKVRLARGMADGRPTLIRKSLRPEYSEEGRKSLALYKAHLERNVEISCDSENLFTPDDCPSLPPLEQVGQRFRPPFAAGRFLVRDVQGGDPLFSVARITETSACIDAMSPAGKERAVVAFGIPFLPRLGSLPHHRIEITAHLHGFWEMDNFYEGDVAGRRCGYTNRGVVTLLVPGVSGARTDYVLFDSECSGSRHGELPAELRLDLPATLPTRLHIAWLMIESCVEPPRSRALACFAELARRDRPLGFPIDDCDGVAQASNAITMTPCAVDLVYRERTILEIERERRAEELKERVRLR